MGRPRSVPVRAALHEHTCTFGRCRRTEGRGGEGQPLLPTPVLPLGGRSELSVRLGERMGAHMCPFTARTGYGAPRLPAAHPPSRWPTAHDTVDSRFGLFSLNDLSACWASVSRDRVSLGIPHVNPIPSSGQLLVPPFTQQFGVTDTSA